MQHEGKIIAVSNEDNSARIVIFISRQKKKKQEFMWIGCGIHTVVKKWQMLTEQMPNLTFFEFLILFQTCGRHSHT